MNEVLFRRQRAHTVIMATSTATAAPGDGSVAYICGGIDRVRTLCAYSGTVTACAIRIWFRDPVEEVWYEGASTDDLDMLTPGGATPVNEARDWDIGSGSAITFQVASIAGGGTVTLRAQGV